MLQLIGYLEELMIRYLEELIHFIVLLSLMPLAEEDVEMGTQIRQFIGFPKTRKNAAGPKEVKLQFYKL